VQVDVIPKDRPTDRRRSPQPKARGDDDEKGEDEDARPGDVAAASSKESFVWARADALHPEPRGAKSRQRSRLPGLTEFRPHDQVRQRERIRVGASR
jgi:hypothetical protein